MVGTPRPLAKKKVEVDINFYCSIMQCPASSHSKDNLESEACISSVQQIIKWLLQQLSSFFLSSIYYKPNCAVIQHLILVKLMALLLDLYRVSPSHQSLKHTSNAACCFLSERPLSVILRPVSAWTWKQSPPGSGACRRVSGSWACTHLSAQPEEVTCRSQVQYIGNLLCWSLLAKTVSW